MEKKLVPDSPQKNPSVKLITGVILAIGVLFVTYQIYANKIVAKIDVETEKKIDIPSSWIGTVERHTFFEFFEISSPLQTATKSIITTSIEGKITDIYVENGDDVKKGQDLLAIDAEDLKQQVQLLQSRIALLAEDLKNARDIEPILRQKRQLTKELAEQGKLKNARYEYENARRDHLQKLQELQQLTKKHESLLEKNGELQQLIQQSVIRAPASGIIAKLANRVGDLPGHPICEILSTTEYIVAIPPGQQKLELSVGQKVLATHSQGVFTGKITEINRDIDENVVAIVEAKDLKFNNEEIITWKFTTAEYKNAPAIRKEMVVARDNHDYIFAVKAVAGHKKVFAIPIKFDAQDDEYYKLPSSILEKVDWNTQILLDGHRQVEDGDVINVVEQ